jgi:serine protease Do
MPIAWPQSRTVPATAAKESSPCLRGIVIAATIAAAFVLPVCSPASAAPPLESAEEQAFREAAAHVAKSVVRIQTVGGVDRVGEYLTGTAATTGVIVSEDGYIVSSAFNFISKPTSILIQLEHAGPVPARLVATDRLRMLTLLKVDAPNLPSLRPHRGKPVRAGQWVIALGRTYDSAEPSISVGIVSAVNRVWGKAIQTDAKVSPVNYGGPLVDIAGNVLGVVVPLSPTGKEETAGVDWYDSGIGFAIPFDDVLASVERLKKSKDLLPGLLGVSFKEQGLDERPAIDHVRFDSPAEKAGLKAGDVILELEGLPIRRFDEVKQALGRKYSGDKATIVVRRGESRIKAETTLVDVLLPFEPGFLGILPERNAGGRRPVMIRFVFPNSAAAAAGLVKGDRIRKWNGTEITGGDQLASLVRRVRPQTKASVVVVHEGTEKAVSVTVGTDVETVPAELPPLGASTPPPGAVKPQPENKKPKMGHFRDKLAGETSAGYWAYVPDSYSDRESWGLLLWFAPSADSMEAMMLSRWKAVCAERRLLIVAPTPSEAAGFNPNDLVGVRQILEHFVTTYRVDKNRIVVHGFSLSGAFASEFALENREQVRGLALASGLLAGAPPDGHPNFPMRFFLSCAEGGQMAERMRRGAQFLRRIKFSVTLQTTPGRDRPTYLADDEVAELARWIDILDRI